MAFAKKWYKKNLSEGRKSEHLPIADNERYI